MPALPRKRSPDGASTDWGGEHLIAAHYSFVDPERMKGWVGLVWRQCCDHGSIRSETRPTKPVSDTDWQLLTYACEIVGLQHSIFLVLMCSGPRCCSYCTATFERACDNRFLQQPDCCFWLVFLVYLNEDCYWRDSTQALSWSSQEIQCRPIRACIQCMFAWKEWNELLNTFGRSRFAPIFKSPD